MHLLLVDNLVLPDRDDLGALDVHPHLGLISLAAVAEREGHQVAILDPKRYVRSSALAYDGKLHRNFGDILLAASPDAVGFTTLGCSFLFAVKVARHLKKARPNLPILLGGPHATILHREVMAGFPEFDVIVRHEAEETFPCVLDSLESREFGAIPGLTWRSRCEPDTVHSTPGLPMVRDLDTLPIPRYDLYPVEELGLDAMRVEAGRGCPFMCTFCSTASFFQRSYRLKSPQRLVHEMDLLHERYGTVDFKLSHDLFTVDRKKVVAFCDVVRGRGYRWRVSARVDCVDAELLAIMADAGCDELYFGIETGSVRMQKIAKKRLDIALVEPMLTVAASHGIRTTASFITGYPEELDPDLDDTLDMLGTCTRPPASASHTQLHLLMPEPGTEIFNQFRDRLEYDGYPGPFNAHLLESGDEGTIREQPEIFATYYFYPPAIPRRRHLLAFEAWQALSAMDPDVLTYALRFYGGRVSRLVQALGAWMEEYRPGRRVDAAAIEEFIACAHEPRHHLTSLVRYTIGTRAIRQAHRSLPAGPAPSPGVTYKLSPGAVLFDNLHDCGTLLDRIRNAPADAAPFDDASTGACGDYLVVASGGQLKNYSVSNGLLTILKIFQQPRMYDEVASVLGDREPLLEELIALGVLAPASS